MKANGKHTRAIWVASGIGAAKNEAHRVEVIDQQRLPHHYATRTLQSLNDAADAIRVMTVRGAPLIGATAAYGVALAMHEAASDAALNSAHETLAATRPTAVNLHWALGRMRELLAPLPAVDRAEAAWQEAARIADEDVAQNRAIGDHGAARLRELTRKDRPLQLMTHCNAGWLATVDYGTALSPIYTLHDAGVPVHVWVSETRPRNQGLLTAWELAQHGVPHTLIADNAAGLLLMRGEVDAVITGADRIAANGDAANKIGTYLKALAALEHRVPFYIAAPVTTIDWACASGREIPIEERDGDEIRFVGGTDAQDLPTHLRQLAASEAVSNLAFDVTPAKLIAGIITERGIAAASRAGLAALYPEHTAPQSANGPQEKRA